MEIEYNKRVESKRTGFVRAETNESNSKTICRFDYFVIPDVVKKEDYYGGINLDIDKLFNILNKPSVKLADFTIIYMDEFFIESIYKHTLKEFIKLCISQNINVLVTSIDYDNEIYHKKNHNKLEKIYKECGLEMIDKDSDLSLWVLDLTK